MLLNDPVTLLLIIIPFGLMTTLMLCLSWFGMGKPHTALYWWVAGDLFLAAYRIVDLLQPGIASGDYAWLGVLSPVVAFLLNTTLLLFAIGGHSLALYQLSDHIGSGRRQASMLLVPPLLYGLGACLLLYTSYIVPWFLFTVMLAIGLQFCVTYGLKARFRGAWGLLAGYAALLVFHGYNTLGLLIDPMPPLPFDEPDMFSLMALGMDFMVSFLFTLCFALMLQEQLRAQVVQISITDTLTGALNRRGAVSTILNKASPQYASQRYPLAIAMVDLDHFKQINDQYGHAAGDAGLQAFAATVSRLKRKTDVFVRWGGEEFLLAFPGTDIQQARHFMGRLRDALRSEPLTPALPFPLAFSAGLAQTHALENQDDFENLLRSVDKALYRAKLHRDRVELVELADT
jgi:diguanylate cyclase (GGDEF)-like protein